MELCRTHSLARPTKLNFTPKNSTLTENYIMSCGKYLGVRRFLAKSMYRFFGYYLGLYGIKNITICNLYIGGPLNYKPTSITYNAKPIKIWRGMFKVHIINEYNYIVGSRY